MVGTSGRSGCARRRRDAEHADLAGADRPEHRRHGGEHRLDVAADQVHQRRPGALVRDVDDVDAGVHLEQLHRQLRRGADAGRCVVELARTGFREGDEFRDRRRRDRRDGRRARWACCRSGRSAQNRPRDRSRASCRARGSPRAMRYCRRRSCSRPASRWAAISAPSGSARPAPVVDDDLLAERLRSARQPRCGRRCRSSRPAGTARCSAAADPGIRFRGLRQRAADRDCQQCQSSNKANALHRLLLDIVVVPAAAATGLANTQSILCSPSPQSRPIPGQEERGNER